MQLVYALYGGIVGGYTCVTFQAIRCGELSTRGLRYNVGAYGGSLDHDFLVSQEAIRLANARGSFGVFGFGYEIRYGQVGAVVFGYVDESRGGTVFGAFCYIVRFGLGFFQG